MNESKISVRYAKAIIAQAKEEKILDTVRSDFDFISNCIKQIPELKLLTDSPVIRTSEKKAIFNKSIGDNIHPLTLSFIGLILTNKREKYLESISRYFIYLYNKEMGISPSLLLTPKELDHALREKIIRMMSHILNIKIELSEQYDEKLIGGFILRIEDQQIDASVASQLAKIRKGLTN
jgi:F-type H+-transporting ATPase subunit delta